MPGSHTNTNKSHSYTNGKTLLNEPEVVRLQKEVDSYTRKLEQEKRKLFSIEETYAMVVKELKERKQKVINLQKATRETDFKKSISKIKNLENSLDKAITRYNEILAQNKALRSEIDVLRRERTNFIDIYQGMNDQLEKASVETDTKNRVIEKRKNKSVNTQHQIYLLKTKNEEEKVQYVQHFENLQKQIKDEKKQKDLNAKTLVKPKEKIENFDTHTILKRRLQKIILNNKEKVKVIEQYQRNMRIIDDAFNRMKEGSGIADIEEITNTFIKSEEQNYSLYNYVDILTQEIDNLEDSNKDLEEKIAIQENENEQRRAILAGTPAEEKNQNRIRAIIKEKEKLIKELQTVLEEISPNFQNLLNDFSKSVFNNKSQNLLYDFENDFSLTENTIDTYLAILEEYLNSYISYKVSTKNIPNPISQVLLLDEIPVKDFSKNKNLTAPVLEKEDLKEENTKLLTPDKLREVAYETIEKKKQGSLNLSGIAPNP